MTRSWTLEDFRRWTTALRLAAEPWLAEMLIPLGIRPTLADHRKLFETLRDEATTQVSLWEREDRPAIVSAVVAGLKKLSAASSIEDAKSFQRWSRRHFVCRDAPIALYVWGQLLRHLSRPSGEMYAKVTPPEPVAPAIIQAAKLVVDERIQLIENRIRGFAPSPSASDIEIGLDTSSQALAAIEVLHAETTMIALVRLAINLTPAERKLTVRWAEIQAAALDFPPDRLGGGRFLSEEPVCADAPPAILIASHLPE